MLWDTPGSPLVLGFCRSCSLCLGHSCLFIPAHPLHLRSGACSSRKPSGPPGSVLGPLFQAPTTQPCPFWGCLRVTLSPLDFEPQEQGARPVSVITVSPAQGQTQSRASGTMRGRKN